MVETIHKKEVTSEETTKNPNLVFKMPKNIKQIGKTGQNPEIYIEDYAESYLRRLSECDYTECRAAVLVGEVVQLERNRVIFIHGAVEAEGAVKENELHFTQEIWDEVYEQMKQYFPNREVVGWFLGGPGFLLEAEEMLLRTHLDQFAGKDRVFYKVDSIEKEAGFYLYEQSCLCMRPGFFIYYEKNEEMQNYMLSRKETHSTEFGFEEPTLKELRQVLQKKQEEKQEPEERKKESRLSGRKEQSVFSDKRSIPSDRETELSDLQEDSTKDSLSGVARLFYTAGTLAAFTVLLIGLAVLQNLETKESMQDTLNQNRQTTVVPTLGTLPQITQAEAEKEGNKTDIFTYLESQGVMVNQDVTAAPTFTATPAPTIQAEQTVSMTPVPGESEQVFVENGVSISEDMIHYTVQQGDTLAGICYRQYGSTERMEEIKLMNQIVNENKIYIGQLLLLPE